MRNVLILIGLLVVLLGAGCVTGGLDSSLDDVPTPTPLPTPIVPEKPQYTVEEGTVVNALRFNGRISPITEAQLAFETSGSVSAVNVSEGDDVAAGTVLAELNVTEQERAIRTAEQALADAQRTLEAEEAAHGEKILQAEIGLQKAALSNSSGGGNGQALLNLQQAVADAQTAVDQTAQQYQEAVADPNSDQAYVDALAQQLQQVEQSLLVAEDNLKQGQAGPSSSSRAIAELDRIEQERAYLALLQGIDPSFQIAVEKAENDLADAQSNLQNAQLIAPFNGRILSVSIRRGSVAEPFQTVVVMAQLDGLELTANLDADDLEKLSVGQTAQISLLNRPEATLSGTVRTLPYPYGGGSGSGGSSERVIRIQIDTDASLTLGELAEVTVVLQEKENVLWLPPAAIRKFQGRTFVVVQRPGGQQRVDVRLGIESDERVEILDGVEAGQLIVGE